MDNKEMNELRHACKDCKHSRCGYGVYDERITRCYEPSHSINKFYTYEGYRIEWPENLMYTLNSDGGCKWFEPSLRAKFLRLFGKRY